MIWTINEWKRQIRLNCFQSDFWMKPPITWQNRSSVLICFTYLFSRYSVTQLRCQTVITSRKLQTSCLKCNRRAWHQYDLSSSNVRRICCFLSSGDRKLIKRLYHITHNDRRKGLRSAFQSRWNSLKEDLIEVEIRVYGELGPGEVTS